MLRIADSKLGSDTAKRFSLPWKSILVKYNTVFIFIVLLIISSFLSQAFFTEANIFNLLRQLSGLAIISMGMLLVILIGGIDLSVGSVLALGCVLSAYFLQSLPLPLAVVLTIVCCTLIGVGSGYFVAMRGIASFVVTLAFMTIARGLAFIVSKGTPIKANSTALVEFGSGSFLGVPFPVWLMLVIFLLVGFLLKFTTFGRLIKAIGSNETAVGLSGILVGRYKFIVFAMSAALCSLAGIISTSRTLVGSPVVGTGIELDAIAAVVIGGASLSGGRGTALNTLIGVLILGMISNIMNLMNVAAYPQQVIKGIIILIAVLLQGGMKKKI
ncbi:ABC transporter permease [Paenibacillus sp. N3.4]|uniref:ABC transporter permease n=1 Tax=Paenibacillus sp. N3.4 TaxID=2603222 RepID=UPI0011CA4AD6|nr:ABC transporter permease [Paenibacillus sp. N3.4]TXK77185.1 ABC transporter permease [Paenibacillus sp. N3.4]